MVNVGARARPLSCSIGRLSQGRQFGDPAVALLWLGLVDGAALTRWGIASMCVAMRGMTIIAIQPQS
jgi:hypothetical protein